jgi:HK97 family phage prohead protease
MLHKYLNQRLSPPGTAPKVAQSTTTTGGKKSQHILRGYGLKFGQKYWMGDHYEVIAPQALKYTDMSDVRCLFNHDVSQILGRTTAGTLKLTVNEIGLLYECPLPDSPLGQTIAEALKRRDVSQSSFSFYLRTDESRKYYGDRWEQDSKGVITRHITDIRLIFDIGPVTNPASPSTEAGLAMEGLTQKSLERWKAGGATPTLAPNKAGKYQGMTEEEFQQMLLMI